MRSSNPSSTCARSALDKPAPFLDRAVRLGAHARSLPVGAATLARDGLGRQVLSIQLVVLPSDGRCYLSLQEVLTLARELTLSVQGGTAPRRGPLCLVWLGRDLLHAWGVSSAPGSR